MYFNNNTPSTLKTLEWIEKIVYFFSAFLPNQQAIKELDGF